MADNLATAAKVLSLQLGGLDVRQVEGFSMYFAVEDGRIFTSNRCKPRPMKPIRAGEYRGVQISRDTGERVRFYTHRFICTAFHGACPEGNQCRHLDGQKTNDRQDNLSWGTPTQNNLDKKAHGTSGEGETNAMAVLTEEKVKKMRAVRKTTGTSYGKIGTLFGVSQMTAYRAVVGISWSHI